MLPLMLALLATPAPYIPAVPVLRREGERGKEYRLDPCESNVDVPMFPA